MGLIWAVLAVAGASVGVVWVTDRKRRSGFARSLPSDMSGRARRSALRAERLKRAHVRQTRGARPSGDRGNVGGA